MSKRAKLLTSVLIKPAGPDCNLACRYCFYLDKGQLFPQASVHRMSQDVLEATVRQVMTQGEQNISFGWQGGEPTLMGLDFFKKAVDLERKHGRSGQTVANGLQTNGLLIDKQWCEFLREALFLVGLSLDGPRHVHDHYRLTPAGKPTWEQVVASLRMMLDNRVEVNALTVVSDYAAGRAREIYEFHTESGLRHMQFIPCVERDPADARKLAPFSVPPERFGGFLCEAFDCWLADFDDGRPTTFIRWFDSLVFGYVGLAPPECTLLEECGNYVVVEHNGDVFACDFFVEDRWRLGNILAGSLPEMLNSPKQTRFGLIKQELPQECHACPWLTHCRGGCPKERLPAPGRDAPSHLCEAYKMFFEHADATLKALAQQWHEQQRTQALLKQTAALRAQPDHRVQRNDPCPCGSGRKYKRCCGSWAG